MLGVRSLFRISTFPFNTCFRLVLALRGLETPIAQQLYCTCKGRLLHSNMLPNLLEVAYVCLLLEKFYGANHGETQALDTNARETVVEQLASQGCPWV